MVFDEIWTRRAVNKAAALAIQQSGCADLYELNGLKEERDLLRKNLTVLMRQSHGGRLSRADKQIITDGNKRLQKLNAMLKPIDEVIRRNRCKTYEEAMRKALRDVYGAEVADSMDRMAKEFL